MEATMEEPSDELARVVRAAYILSYLNKYTIVAYQTISARSDDGDHDEELEDDVEVESTDHSTHLLTAVDTSPRQKFLNCIAELLAHTRGGQHVTATALRESEDRVEIDVARNRGFVYKDAAYLSSLSWFLSACVRRDGEYTQCLNYLKEEPG
jgi:hypothetical protein